MSDEKQYRGDLLLPGREPDGVSIDLPARSGLLCASPGNTIIEAEMEGRPILPSIYLADDLRQWCDDNLEGRIIASAYVILHDPLDYVCRLWFSNEMDAVTFRLAWC